MMTMAITAVLDAILHGIAMLHTFHQYWFYVHLFTYAVGVVAVRGVWNYVRFLTQLPGWVTGEWPHTYQVLVVVVGGRFRFVNADWCDTGSYFGSGVVGVAAVLFWRYTDPTPLWHWSPASFWFSQFNCLVNKLKCLQISLFLAWLIMILLDLYFHCVFLAVFANFLGMRKADNTILLAIDKHNSCVYFSSCSSNI